jgi:hypothetical protein
MNRIKDMDPRKLEIMFLRATASNVSLSGHDKAAKELCAQAEQLERELKKHSEKRHKEKGFL